MCYRSLSVASPQAQTYVTPTWVGVGSSRAQDTTVSLAYHTSGFTPAPSLLTTGLSFWDRHINGTTFLIALGSWSQVKTGTTIFKERWAGPWKGKEASVTAAISLLSRDSPWDKVLHEHLGCSDYSCQEWGEAQIVSSGEVGQYVVHWLRKMLLSTSKTS